MHPNTRKSGACRGPRNPPRAHFAAAAARLMGKQHLVFLPPYDCDLNYDRQIPKGLAECRIPVPRTYKSVLCEHPTYETAVGEEGRKLAQIQPRRGGGDFSPGRKPGVN